MPEIMFNGSAGKLQGRYRKGHKNAPIALLMHPDPTRGGSMDNIIVHRLYHIFRNLGFSTLRFNFRGVGKSQGEFDYGPGELADAADALNWAQNFIGEYKSCWVAGYSFGSWIAMQLLMRRPEIKGFIIISPPKIFDFSFLAPCPASGLVVCGEDDKVADKTTVENLITALEKQQGNKINSNFIPNADHFYNNKIDELMEICDDYIRSRLTKEIL